MEPNASLKAYAYEFLAKIAQASGDKERVTKFRDEVTKLDRYFSKAFGIQNEEIFSPPGEVVLSHSYLFSPF